MLKSQNNSKQTNKSKVQTQRGERHRKARGVAQIKGGRTGAFTCTRGGRDWQWDAGQTYQGGVGGHRGGKLDRTRGTEARQTSPGRECKAANVKPWHREATLRLKPGHKSQIFQQNTQLGCCFVVTCLWWFQKQNAHVTLSSVKTMQGINILTLLSPSASSLCWWNYRLQCYQSCFINLVLEYFLKSTTGYLASKGKGKVTTTNIQRCFSACRTALWHNIFHSIVLNLPISGVAHSQWLHQGLRHKFQGCITFLF